LSDDDMPVIDLSVQRKLPAQPADIDN